MSIQTEIDRFCFVCGPENQAGIQVRFETGERSARGVFTTRELHQGYVGMSHGGVVAAVLDEAMVYAAVTLGRWVTTAELTIRYSRPTPTGVELYVRSEVTRHQRRLVECRAEIHDAEGQVLAVATGKLMQGREIREEERTE